MRNWKYINGAEGVKIGNDFSEKEKILMEIKGLKEERAGWIRHKQEHPENKNLDDIIKSYTKDISDLQEKLLKVGNDTPAEYAKRPPKIVGGNKKCGNAFSKGQVLGEEGSKKYVFGGEINGTYIVYRQPDGGTYSFSSEQEIKDWLRASKIGNAEAQELEKDVEKKDKEKVDEVEELKKTGNEKISYRGVEIDLYGTENGMYTYKYEIKQNKGKKNVPLGGQGRATLDSIKKQIDEDLAASKVGNSAYDDGAKKGKEDKRKGKQITAAGFEYHAPGYSSLSFKEKEEYRKGYYSTNDLKKEDIYKWGNSAQDDKFAYVMREFDEGKLKTPDGKVVTDPAQAKAIAYSESKKTENGLARARNAMAKNKKVKNSAVREYEHPDGRVAQIDFNEDGSDADMSIYDGSKEIEQRNFSTIRDAEQYVTSHGFRRI